MNLKIEPECVQSIGAPVFPQLKQALDILRMNSNDLFGYVEKQLEINPVLDVADYEKPFISSQVYENMLPELEYGEEYKIRSRSMGGDSLDNMSDYQADCVSSKLSLKEYLLLQLNGSGLDKVHMQVGEYLISNVDENGYLTCNLTEAAAYFNVQVAIIKKVLRCLQSFDPPGICARNLRECLLIQLKQMNITDRNVYRVVEGFLGELALNRVSEVALRTNLDKDDVSEIFKLIKTLEPKPGRDFYSSSCFKYLMPDIFIRRVRNGFEAIINEEVIPIVHIDKYYKHLASQEISPEARKFIKRKINNAVWLIKCIEQRKTLMMKIAEYIAGVQKEFFEEGESGKKTVSIEQAARDMNIDTELIAIAVEGKFVQCRWEIFEMGYFFTN